MEKRKLRFIYFQFVTLFFAYTSFVFPQVQHRMITAKAIWNPDMATMEKIYENCGSYTGVDLKNCFIKVMQESGASGQAIEFTSMMNNDAYMNGYKNLGNVDAAFVYYPLQSDNHNGCVLVNGLPGIINVDDDNLLPVGDMELDKGYKDLEKTYTHIALFPGDRKSTVYPYNIELPDKENRVVVNYSIKNGCNTCELLGFAEFGFDFDSTGKFIGCKFLNLKKTVEDNSQSSVSDYNTNYFSDPSQPVDVKAGDKFSIILVSNHSEGFKWQLAGSLDDQVLSLTGTNFIRPIEILPNAPGKEVWYFKAVSKGSTKINFDYVHSWSEGTKTYEKYSFTVDVR